ncbi:putative histone-fold protein [Helianthus annuus]|nr:putative histone-fold protein [Helianthus annuus]
MTTETSPATAKAKSTGKRKIKKSGALDTAPITLSSTSNPHNHESNGSKSTSKSYVDLTGETVSVDDAVKVSPSSNGVNVSTKKKKKNEDNHKKKIKDESDEKDGSLLYQIPMSRVSRIIKSEDPNIRITQESVYIINKASECSWMIYDSYGDGLKIELYTETFVVISYFSVG